MKRGFLFSLIVALMAPAVAQADPYPAEVRDAFMGECLKGGNQEVCSCVLSTMEREISLADLAAQNFTTEQIEKMTEDCMAGSGSVATKKLPEAGLSPVSTQTPDSICSKHAKEADEKQECLDALTEIQTALGPALWEEYANCVDEKGEEGAETCANPEMQKKLVEYFKNK